MASAQFFKNAPTNPIARRQVRCARILLVEGYDELWFFDHLLSQLHADPADVQIIDYDGIDKFETNVRLLLKDNIFVDESVRALAIIQDADRKRAKRSYDLEHGVAKNVLGMEGFKVGCMTKIASWKELYAGAFLLPKPPDDGNLETLMLSTVSHLPAVIDATKYLVEHDESGAADRDKRVNQIYLATKKDLARGAGMAARSGCFDLDHAALDELKEFIESFLNV